MKNGRKWVWCMVCLALLFCGTAFGQAGPTDYNRLCLHSGGEYYIGSGTGFVPNMGTGKYYPSYTHIASTPTAGIYEWKIKGWAWVGMKGPAGTSVFEWTGMLQEVESNDYNYTAVPSVTLSCTFPAAHAWASGALMTAGTNGVSNPAFTYGPGGLPSSMLFVAGKDFVFPSTGTFATNANLFAIHHSTIDVGMVTPYYGYDFSVTLTTDTLTVASTTSIYQWLYQDQSAVDFHYLLATPGEKDQFGGNGYKGLNQMFISRPPYLLGWSPSGASSYSVDMCLLVEDSVLIPVNIHSNVSGPFSGFGYEVGIACMTPLVTGGNARLGFATEDYKAAGEAYAIMASRHMPGSEYIGALQYDNNRHRYPCGGIDGVTQFFLNRFTVWLHTVSYPFPVCAWGTYTVGGYSAQVNIGPTVQPTLPGKEYIFCGFPTNAISNDCTAGYMVCWR